MNLRKRQKRARSKARANTQMRRLMQKDGAKGQPTTTPEKLLAAKQFGAKRIRAHVKRVEEALKKRKEQSATQEALKHLEED